MGGQQRHMWGGVVGRWVPRCKREGVCAHVGVQFILSMQVWGELVRVLSVWERRDSQQAWLQSHPRRASKVEPHLTLNTPWRVPSTSVHLT